MKINWFKRKVKFISSAEALKIAEARIIIVEQERLEDYKNDLFKTIKRCSSDGSKQCYVPDDWQFSRYEVELTKLLKATIFNNEMKEILEEDNVD